MRLADFFRENNKTAIAFSGGVDSAYLLYEAIKNKADVKAYYVKSAFQPQFELEDAERLAKQLKAEIKVIHLDVLASRDVESNPMDRCYHCKNMIFKAIAEAAASDGFDVILDGTNASDDEADRPGMAALKELKVRSPLGECGLTKVEIRKLSREAGLFTWNKPAYACLATRIATGEKITVEKLETTEEAEAFIASLGFTDFRVRMEKKAAKIQLPEAQLDMLIRHRTEVIAELKKYYESVLLDLEVRG